MLILLDLVLCLLSTSVSLVFMELYVHRLQKKKVPLIFFAVTFTNVDGF